VAVSNSAFISNIEIRDISSVGNFEKLVKLMVNRVVHTGKAGTNMAVS